MAERRRAHLDEYAERLNGALALLQRNVPAAATHALADAHGISERQARRYVVEAQHLDAPVEVPERSEVFTVRLPSSLIVRVRDLARARGESISAVTARALRDGLKEPKRRRGGTTR
jgi:hypothetical protein